MRPLDILVRLEWLAVLVAAIVFYAVLDASWLLFAVLILAPDLAMLFYLAGPRIGAISYNAVHALAGPAILFLVSLVWPVDWAAPVALIWLAHIAADRMLGYG